MAFSESEDKVRVAAKGGVKRLHPNTLPQREGEAETDRAPAKDAGGQAQSRRTGPGLKLTLQFDKPSQDSGKVRRESVWATKGGGNKFALQRTAGGLIILKNLP